MRKQENTQEPEKIARDIVAAIVPICRGKSFGFIDSVFDYARVLVQRECRFSPGTSATKQGRSRRPS